MNHHNRKKPIGIFDSGVGGLTVASAVTRHLPNEQIIYFGDTAHLPYGDKSADSIRYYSLQIAKYLIDLDCKAVVVACNSASSAAYPILLDFYKEKAIIINVVDPLVSVVSDQSFKKVGVLATKTTVQSGVYSEQLKLRNPKMDIGEIPAPLLAPMIEEGYIHDKISHVVIERYLNDPGLDQIEALLLACTHYPLIKDEIQKMLPLGVKTYDSTDTTANHLKKALEKADLLNDKNEHTNRFIVSEYTSTFERTTSLFYGNEVHLEEDNIWKPKNW